MIEQYLSNTNKSATVSISQNFLQLNKALKDSPSHQIFKRMHRVLNIDENKN